MQSIRVIGAILLSLLPLEVWGQESKWFELVSPHFVLLTDTSEVKGRRLLTDFEGRLAAFAGAFGMVPARQFPVQVFLFSKTEEFNEAVPAGTVKVDRSAYFMKGPDRDFVVARDKSPEDIADDVGHALGHSFFERYVLWRPFWLSEAAGEYFRKVGRNPDTKSISVEDGFAASDLLTIVPSATYQDSDPGGAFRTQSYRLLRIFLDERAAALKDLVQALKTEVGAKATPVKDPANESGLDARLQSYVETTIKAGAPSQDIKSAAIDSGHVSIRRGDLMLAMGKTEEAGRWYNANTAEARAARAILNRFSRAGGEALRGLDRVSRESPDAGLVQFHFGSIETKIAKDIELQVVALERAVSLLPLMGRAYGELARVYTLSGNPEKAIAASDRAIQLEPEFADRFYDIRADALAGLNRFDEAYKTVQIAAALPHKDRPAVEAYDRKIPALAKRIEDIRRDADDVRLRQLRADVGRKAAELEPPKPPAPVETVREGRISYEIEARGPVEVMQQFFPEYPAALIKKGSAGAVTLLVAVGADGRVTSATVSTSQVPELNAATIEATKRWVFKPVERAGRGVPFTIKLIFQYVLQ